MEMYEGEYRIFHKTLEDNEAAIDLDYYDEINMTVKADKGMPDASAIFSLSTDNDAIQILDAANGKIALRVNDVKKDCLGNTVGKYSYDIQLTKYLNGGPEVDEVRTAEVGSFVVKKTLINSAVIDYQTIQGTVTFQSGNGWNDSAQITAQHVETGDEFTTDINSDGSYSLQGVTVGQINVQASCNGYTSETTSVTIADGETITQNFNLVTQVIQGTILFPYGTGWNDSALVTITNDDTNESFQTSVSSDGSYSIQDFPPGTYTVEATCDDYTSETTSVSVDEGETVIVNFTLTTQIIQGIITFQGGTGWNDSALVTITNDDTNESFQTNVNNDGSYVIQDFPPGTYTVEATCDNYTTNSVEGVEVGEGVPIIQNITLDTTLAGVSGTVTFIPSGAEDLSDAIIEVGDGLETVNPDENGEYEAWVAAGTYDIQAYMLGNTETIEDVTLTAGYGNIVENQDFELQIQALVWIKCSGTTGDYCNGSNNGMRYIPKWGFNSVEQNKYIKFTQDTFVAIFQEMKIELNLGVPTISINLKPLYSEETIYSHTFTETTLNTNTEYNIYNEIYYDSSDLQFYSLVQIEDSSGTVLDEHEIAFYVEGLLQWDNTLHNGKWGEIDNGEIYIKDMGGYIGNFHDWNLDDLQGSVIPDSSTEEENKIDLELSNDMEKIWE